MVERRYSEFDDLDKVIFDHTFLDYTPLASFVYVHNLHLFFSSLCSSFCFCFFRFPLYFVAFTLRLLCLCRKCLQEKKHVRTSNVWMCVRLDAKSHKGMLMRL